MEQLFLSMYFSELRSVGIHWDDREGLHLSDVSVGVGVKDKRCSQENRPGFKKEAWNKTGDVSGFSKPAGYITHNATWSIRDITGDGLSKYSYFL